MAFPPLYKGIPAHYDDSDSKQKTITPLNHLIFKLLTSKVIVNTFFIKIKSRGHRPLDRIIDNIRQMHFSRNSKIVQFMQQYELVKEFGEGVDCMFREMAEAGNPAPEYKQVEFMVKVKLTSAMRDENVEKN